MKLHSVHIENFGRLQAVDRSFDEHLEVICTPNGSGKTTLAAFLCAMLYGLEDSRRRNAPGERAQYRPWAGGVYGGSLVFSVGSRRYRVQRTFGMKKKEDVFLLFDDRTNMPSSDYGEDLGQAILGIDAAAFRETLYHAQPTAAGGDSRRAVGEGSVAALSAPSSGIRAMITDAEGQDEALRGCGQAIARVRREAEALRPDRKNSPVRAAQDRADRLKAQSLEAPVLEERSDRLRRQLAEDTDRLRVIDEETVRLQERTAALGRALEARRILQAQAMQDQEQALALSEAQNLQAQLDSARLQLAEVEAEMARPAADDPSAAAYPVLKERLLLVRSRLRETDRQRRRLNRELRETRQEGRSLQTAFWEDQAQLRTLRQILKSPFLRLPLRAGAGAAGILLLLVCLFLAFSHKGGPAAAVGLIAAAVTGCALLLTLRADRTERSAAALEAELKESRSALRSLRTRADETEAALREAEDAFRSLRTESRRLQADLDAAASVPGLTRLRDRERQLKARCADLEKAHEEAARRAASGGEGLSPAYAASLRAEADLAETEPLTIQELTEEAAALREEQARLRGEAASLTAELDTVNQAWEEASAAGRQAEEAAAKAETLTGRHHLLSVTADCLQQALEDYNRRFMHPFQQAFEDYCDLLRSEPLLLRSDANLAVQAEAQGLPRPLSAFSAGTQDLLLLCRRLALLDCMYRDEQPFLILDDPFVNLDSQHLEAALRLCRRLAQDRQILYLTCHESRVPS